MKKLELEKKDIESILQTSTIKLEEITTNSKRLGEIINLINEKEIRWIELEEKK